MTDLLRGGILRFTGLIIPARAIERSELSIEPRPLFGYRFGYGWIVWGSNPDDGDGVGRASGFALTKWGARRAGARESLREPIVWKIWVNPDLTPL